MRPDQIKNLINEYAQLATAEFSFEDLVDDLRKKGVKTEEDWIYNLTISSDCLFAQEDFQEDNFIPRHVFFKGAQFRITPLEIEVKNGYIIPGHRFIPFVSRDLFPTKFQLILPSGSTIKTRRILVPQEYALASLSFYGSAHATEYLMFDQEDNSSAFELPNDDIKMTVFDLRDYFSETKFQFGDSLLLTVLDWAKGIFSVTWAKPVTDLLFSQKWVASMHDALSAVIYELGTMGTCYEQFALTMKIAQTDVMPLMRNPPLSLAAYFNQQSTFSIKTLDGNGLFWMEDEDFQEVARNSFDDSYLPESKLDAYFKQLGLSISEGEVEAYMRDALYRKETSPETVLARITSGRSLFFESAEEQECFHALWSELWDEVQGNYSRKHDVCAKPRSRFLELNDKCFATIRTLDQQNVGMEVMTNPDFMELSHITTMISAALIMFNTPEKLDDSPDDLIEKTGMLEQIIDELSNSLIEGDVSIYQLKVSIKGAKPPIWRRILIPASMELIDLHHAIQAAMGWYNCHLHQFRQGRTNFVPNPDPEFMGFGGFDDVDSKGMRIDHLLQSEKDKISYEYDFGDSWEHTVLLEKILEPEEGKPYPVCIKGKRACPPEDCGGIWGYYNLLDILENPADEEHEEMLEWVGGKIDPETFDLDEANARLKYYFKRTKEIKK
jgi:hypothetical protein